MNRNAPESADEPAGVHALADMFVTLGALALFAVAVGAGAARETAPDGLESAFALEALLGGVRVRQRRLTAGAWP